MYGFAVMMSTSKNIENWWYYANKSRYLYCELRVAALGLAEVKQGLDYLLCISVLLTSSFKRSIFPTFSLDKKFVHQSPFTEALESTPLKKLLISNC
jgi:hypothetical protein